MWVVQGPTTVVIDTSVPMHGRSNEFIGEDFSRSAAQEPANALRDAGVDPRDVEFVVLTHLHWDHAGNCDLFPDARVLVQQEELRYAVAPGRFFRKSFLAPMSGWPTPPYLMPNLETVDGETELAPGLRLVRAPGHTPGSQAVIVDTETGLVLHRRRRHQHLRQHRAGHPAGVPRERGRLGRFDGPTAR